MPSFIGKKVAGPSQEKRPLGRWAPGRAVYLFAVVAESADRGQPFAEWGRPGLKESVTDLLRDSRWSTVRWHVLRRGGFAACYHQAPHLRFLMWWGRWWHLQTAL